MTKTTLAKGPHIAIVGRQKDTGNYEKALLESGALPVTTMNTGSLSGFDGLLLPGGGDITPAFFGQENQGSHNIDVELDITQLQAMELFARWGKPVLGICKGMQIINVYFGGDIVQHLPNAIHHAWNGSDRFHPADSRKGSVLHSLYGQYTLVNSAHHQSIGKTGHGLCVVQTADDGVPEAIEHDFLPVLGVQWHPERLYDSNRPSQAADGRILLRHFLSVCSSSSAVSS